MSGNLDNDWQNKETKYLRRKIQVVRHQHWHPNIVLWSCNQKMHWNVLYRHEETVMASIHHIFGTKEFPRHGLHPQGLNSWYYFQLVLAGGSKCDQITFQRSSTVSSLDRERERKKRSKQPTSHSQLRTYWSDTFGA